MKRDISKKGCGFFHSTVLGGLFFLLSTLQVQAQSFDVMCDLIAQNARLEQNLVVCGDLTVCGELCASASVAPTTSGCGELRFSAAEFGILLDESCTGLIQDPQAPPYRLSAAYHVFTSDIIYPVHRSACGSQIIVRRMPIIGNPSDNPSPSPGPGPISFAGPPPYPAVDFCVPADFDDNSLESVEVDICFFTLANSDGESGKVSFGVCYEFKDKETQGFAGKEDSTAGFSVIGVNDTPTGEDPLNHYVGTACIPAGSGIKAGDQARLVVLRIKTEEFDRPIYLSTITFRYPSRGAAKLPFNC